MPGSTRRPLCRLPKAQRSDHCQCLGGRGSLRTELRLLQSEMFDCQSCGACCSHKWSWPILRRDRSDASAIEPHLIRSDLPLMKTTDNRCIALTGTVGLSVGCSIYADRPSACRSFKPGSPLCLEARNLAGL
ncbi:MAG: YkgJ family cysteine cluster protein [Proteobacteria bacterium]|nr:YkgJ family cysteine cluster protein [Pseudomonadota bacterium]